MTARKHHWVPRCYLRAFAVERKKGKHQVLTFDKVEHRHFQASIADVAAERDYMSVDIEGHPPDAVESALAKFEDELAVSLRRTAESREFASEDDFNNILNFFCLLHVRNPRMRDMMSAFTERVHKATLSVMLSKPEIWNSQMSKAKDAGFLGQKADTDHKKMKRLDMKDFRVVTSTTEHVRVELDLFNSILPYFFERKWSILRAPAGGGGFVTTDHPVCLINTGPATGHYAVGLGMTDTHPLVPLSKNIAIVGAYEPRPSIINVSARAVANFNGIVIAHAERQVYARDMDFSYQFKGEEARKGSRLIEDRRFHPRSG